MDVVAAAETVVDAQDRFEIRQQIKFRQEIADLVSQHRHAAQATADVHRIAEFAPFVADDVNADVMRAGGGAIAGRRRKRKFELAWQPVEFRMERRPLPGDLAIRRSEERRVGKSGSLRVDLGGRRIIKKKKST